MLEDMGNAVKVLDRIIPAVNIQVDNVPGFLEHVTGPPAWYGIYFEILFEDGDLWVVEQGWDERFPYSDAIKMEEWDRRDLAGDMQCLYGCFGWESFLIHYNEKVGAKGVC